MPYLDYSFLLKLHDDYRKYPNFIESGTFLGSTINNLEPYFPKLYTIEIKPELYMYAKNNYGGNKITFCLGDSSVELTNILKNISDKSILFLDGHWSEGITGRGKKDIPLLEELTQIMAYHINEAIIIIDDIRMFGIGPSNSSEPCSWEDISIQKVFEITTSRIKESYYLPSELHKEDRLILHLKANQ